MRFLKCPQCGISNFYVKDDQGNRVNVKVNSEGQIISANGDIIPDDFNLSELYCLGCSWHGLKTKLVKFLNF